ncbi:MAG: response regulator [Armatimonadota bacterium]|jgi:CheY-like chemotaxis protein
MPERRRVLLVDDDVDFLNAVRLTLEAAGYDVVSAHTGEHAIKLLREAPVEVAILDLMMEEPDSGIAVAHFLRRQPEMRGIPVILATAVTEKTGFRVSLDDPDDRDWLQVDAWVDKPVDPQTLLQEVGRLTRARQSG